jgi:hypothetical protein
MGSQRIGTRVENPRLVSLLVHPMGWVYWYPRYRQWVTKHILDKPCLIYARDLPGPLPSVDPSHKDR